MTNPGFEREVARLTRRINADFGAEVLRLRADAGITRLELARAAGVNDSYLAKIEAGAANPSSEVSVRLAVALGADLAHRLYPRTGPAIRDRHQAPIEEALLGVVHPRWQRFAEVNVHRPARGWIDLGFFAAGEPVFVASEIQSELNRLEQLFRWSASKAESLPSWEGFGRLGAPPVSRLLIVRDTRTNREVARDFRRLISTSYPANPATALASLIGTEPWPGPSVLWATRDRNAGSRYRIVARP